MGKLHDLHGKGQSVWLDFIRRDMLVSGELDTMVADGIRGLTSNPTIFQKAIGGSDAYDDAIRSALATNPDLGPLAVYEMLAVSDIQDAADALRPVYDESTAADGYVSLEVSPLLSADTDGTITEAHRLWNLVDRPNLMIKVPATPEGIPAIEELIAAGINVNATLMFSMADYEAVAQAYVRGISRTANPQRVASVASFFVSRVDTSVDAGLEKNGSPDALAHRGRAAVANAKLAYARYLEIFEGSGFAAQKERGARPQRVLWASTGVKNPSYPDVLYVEPLIGFNTVNTMPPATIDAFLDHGDPDNGALTIDVDAAHADIAALADLDVDLDAITTQLQSDGVKSFADSFDDLMATVAEKISELS
ncbi:MAG: transaldolase [Acidimicrobiia bacterium]|nr:transaldolase [Acidimicrobiia bacterium]MDX2468508.1 transaldolase [Acidimicrobiia bacterium]